MVKFQRLLPMLAVLLISGGCSMKIHKDYAFTSPEHPLGTGKINAKLRGTQENLENDVSVNHAPYEMLLWFSVDHVDSPADCLVAISSVSLKNLETGEYVPIPESDSASFRQRSDGTYHASMNYKALGLSYSDHSLQFSYTLVGMCGLVASQASVTMNFKRDYSERKITFWDTLMGV
ncbi:hypothetical protein ACH42_04685 [Endozoicomonas sp. (ex Bugula neritina AB1)]|nr:hypothetical protein ACH42_04685 [Endozoicomonas sp. (ex Bugula neritina AB1)]